MFFWKLSCEKGVDVLQKTDIQKEYNQNPTNSERRIMHCYTVKCFTSSLVFDGLSQSSLHRQKCAKQRFVVFQLILAASTDSCQFGGTLWFFWTKMLLLIHSCYFLLNWTAGTLTIKSGITPNNYYSTGPQPCFPINILSPLPLVSVLEGRLKHL